MPATGHAGATELAAAAPGAAPPEIGVRHSFARRPEKDRHVVGTEMLLASDIEGQMLQGLVSPEQARVTGGAQHGISRFVKRREFPLPVGQFSPAARLKKSRLGYRQGIGVYQRAAAHAGARYDAYVPENGNFHNTEPTQGRQPQPFGQLPVGFGEIVGAVPFAFFYNQYPVPFFREPKSTDRAAETAADDDIVVRGVHNCRANIAGIFGLPYYLKVK